MNRRDFFRRGAAAAIAVSGAASIAEALGSLPAVDEASTPPIVALRVTDVGPPFDLAEFEDMVARAYSARLEREMLFGVGA